MKPGTLLERHGEDVELPGIKLKLNTRFSALGMIGRLACTVSEGDSIDPPVIRSANGKERPLFVWHYPPNCTSDKYRELIDYKLLLCAIDAEKVYAKIADHIGDKVLPKYREAWNGIKKCKKAYCKSPGRKSYLEITYHTGNPGGINQKEIEDKPKKLLNEVAAKKYRAAEDLLYRWNSRLALYKDVLKKAIQHEVLSKEKKEDYPDAGLAILKINERTYIYKSCIAQYGDLDFSELSFYGPYKQESIHEIVVL